METIPTQEESQPTPQIEDQRPQEKFQFIKEITIKELAKAVDFCNKFLSLPRNFRESMGLQFITSKAPTIIMQLLRTKDAAYHERNRLLAYIAQKNPSYLTEHDPADQSCDDMWRTVLVIELPEGESRWHIHDHEVKLFEKLERKPYAKPEETAI